MAAWQRLNELSAVLARVVRCELYVAARKGYLSAVHIGEVHELHRGSPGVSLGVGPDCPHKGR